MYVWRSARLGLTARKTSNGRRKTSGADRAAIRRDRTVPPRPIIQLAVTSMSLRKAAPAKKAISNRTYIARIRDVTADTFSFPFKSDRQFPCRSYAAQSCWAEKNILHPAFRQISEYLPR